MRISFLQNIWDLLRGKRSFKDFELYSLLKKNNASCCPQMLLIHEALEKKGFILSEIENMHLLYNNGKLKFKTDIFFLKNRKNLQDCEIYFVMYQFECIH